MSLLCKICGHKMVTVQTVRLYAEDTELDYETFIKELNRREWQEQTVCDRCMKGMEPV